MISEEDYTEIVYLITSLKNTPPSSVVFDSVRAGVEGRLSVILNGTVKFKMGPHGLIINFPSTKEAETFLELSSIERLL